jgi:hypothetical protein
MTAYDLWKMADLLGWDWIEPIPTGWLLLSYERRGNKWKIAVSEVIPDPQAEHVLTPLPKREWGEWVKILQEDGWALTTKKTHFGVVEMGARKRDMKIELLKGVWFRSREIPEGDDILQVGDCIERVYVSV